MKAIDLFAGLGGMTEGATKGGAEVLWAANHWPIAVETHAANHKNTDHQCQDLHQADWTSVPAHDLLLASPCCQGHSKARGKDGAHHDASRSTAWAVVSALEAHKPEFFLVENVQEFMSWSLFPYWEMCLKSMGYSMKPHILDAADFGVPQNRVRMFLVGSKSKNPVDLKFKKKKHKAFRPYIQWEADYEWGLVKDRVENTRNRVAKGRKDLGTSTFLMPFYGNSKTGRSLDRPIGTLTTKDRYMIIDGDRCRTLKVPEVLAGMGFPKNYKLPLKSNGEVNHSKSVHLLGNSVCPQVVTEIVKQLIKA